MMNITITNVYYEWIIDISLHSTIKSLVLNSNATNYDSNCNFYQIWTRWI